jgi:NarL family two-component system response regulator LiaR
VGEASIGEEALRICGQVQPDVVLMCLLLPRMDGVAATGDVREQWSQVQVIAMTSFQESRLVQKAFQAGAISYPLKNVSALELAEATRGPMLGSPPWLRKRHRH